MFTDRILVKLYISKVHITQPSRHIRKLDHKIVFYKFRDMFSPIPPSSFKGYLRHLAYIVVSRSGGKYLKAYFSLFGSDIRTQGDPSITLKSKEGKLIVSLREGFKKEYLKKRTRPGIRINRITGSTTREALLFSEYVEITVRKPIIFALEFKEPLSKEEEELLAAALNLMRSGGVLGGWASKGMGFIEKLEVEPADFLEKSSKIGDFLG